MRAELLHEIQDGDEMEDERVEMVSLQWRARDRGPTAGRVRCRPRRLRRASSRTAPGGAIMYQTLLVPLDGSAFSERHCR